MPGLGPMVILLVANVIWLLLNLFASWALKLPGEAAVYIVSLSLPPISLGRFSIYSHSATCNPIELKFSPGDRIIMKPVPFFVILLQYASVISM